MQNDNIKVKVLSSLFWKLMERGGTHGIQFIVQILLARLLLPKDYGIIALVVIFTSVASVFVQSGLNTALIQKKDTDETDFSSVFHCN
jgi:teichuronic acid exporter